MSVTDFLFQGTAPPSVSKYESTTTSLPPWMEAFQQGLINRANVVAGEPYQAYGGPRVAGFSADQTAAFDKIRQNQGSWQPTLNSGIGGIQSGMGASASGAAQPNLATAGGMSALNNASGALGAAAGRFPDAAADYMNPYNRQVTDEIARLGGRNLTENLLPNVRDVFIKSGQFGSTGHADLTGRVVRDANESIMGQQAKVLQEGYGMAGQQFGADQARLAGIGQTIGSLTSSDRGAQIDMGRLQGDLANSDANRQIAGGTALGTMASVDQKLGQQDAAALEATGLAQQQQQQKNLDTGYSDFREQREYDRDMVRFMNESIRGLQQPVSSISSGTGPASSVGASPLAQAIGAGTGLASLKNVLGLKRGGGVLCRVADRKRGGVMRRVAARA